MTIYGSIYSGVSGLNAQGTAVAIISDNIANINTIGYKGSQANFSTLVSASSTANSYSSGSVQAGNRQLIDQQGLVQGTGIATDVAISGDGLFVVNSQTDGAGNTYYTRAGSFRQDSKGNLVNVAGYTLMGWPLDNEGRLPGAAGNANTTSSSLLQSLVPVNSTSITGSATATSQISLSLNLKSSQAVFPGSGELISIPITATSNYGIGALDVIAPDNSGANILNIGDFVTLTPSSTGTATTFTYGGLAQSGDITLGILGSTAPNAVFVGATPGWQFTIDNVTSGLATFTYTPNSPNISSGQFNSPSTLAAAISATSGLSARIDPSNQFLLIAPLDATQGMTIVDIGASTLASSLTITGVIAPAANRFATLNGLKNLVNSTPGLGASLNNPISNSTLKIITTDPLGTLTVDATGSTVGAVTSDAISILSEFGLNTTAPSTFGPAYDPNGTNAPNMSSGGIAPDFTRNIRIYDAFGTGHDILVSFLKTDSNTWSIEVYAANQPDIMTVRTDPQLATGSVIFNGDGSLRSVSNTLLNPINITWANESLPSSITVDWGTAGQVYGTAGAVAIGKTNGLGQLDGDYSVYSTNQNGIATGLLTGLAINNSGFIVANFSNGTSKDVFQMPLATFVNPNGLLNIGGNAYQQSIDSGNFNLTVANIGNAGKISPAALEQSNVELSDELTKMIIAQKGYQASSKIIKTASDMLEDLNRAVS